MGEAMRASVIIVGAGPVGLTLANLLGREGVETLVLERNPETTDEPRAIAADDETLRTMQGLGLLEVWERDLFRDMPGRLRSTSGELLAEIRPAPTGNGYAIFNTFHQPIFERTLLGGAERYPSVSVRFGHEVTGLEQNGNGVTVRGVRPGGDAFEARGAWLVGCDGGRSFVRKHLGIGFVGSTYSERWLVLDTEGDTWNQRDGSFIMDPARPTVTIYRTKGRRRWEFLQMPGETDAFLLDDATIHRLLAPHIDPDAVTVHRKVVYLFHARIAERYGEGRILLAGDAAHVMPPFVGQGMNSGIRDAVNLGWKLAACVRHGASPEILATYEPERREHQRKVTNLSVWVGRLFMQKRRSLAAARNGILRLLRAIPPARAFIERGGVRPANCFREGLTASPPARGSSVGKHLIQPSVLGPDGKSVLLDEMLGSGFALVGVGADPSDWLSAADREWLARLGATIVAIPPPAAGPGRNGQVRVDPEGKLAAWIGTRAARVLLARPDRFVAGDVPPARAGELVRWLRDLLPRAVSAPAPATHDENFVSPEPNGEDHGDQRAAVSN